MRKIVLVEIGKSDDTDALTYIDLMYMTLAQNMDTVYFVSDKSFDISCL